MIVTNFSQNIRVIWIKIFVFLRTLFPDQNPYLYDDLRQPLNAKNLAEAWFPLIFQVAWFRKMPLSARVRAAAPIKTALSHYRTLAQHAEVITPLLAYDSELG